MQTSKKEVSRETFPLEVKNILFTVKSLIFDDATEAYLKKYFRVECTNSPLKCCSNTCVES